MTVHNRKDTTLNCIRHFFQCHCISEYYIDFYLMDDGSTDGTFEAVSSEFPQITILHGNGNLFWNRGMYYCWKEAAKVDHDYYLWLNDDTVLFEKALIILFKDYKSVDKMSIISGCCCDTKTQLKVTYGGWNRHKLVSPNGSIQKISDMNGNCVLIPDCVFKKLGFNDYYFRHSGADNEYGYRAQKYKIGTYISSEYVGCVDRHDAINKSYSLNSLRARLRYLNTPLGVMPKEKFYLLWKYHHYFYAIYVYLKIYLHCIIGNNLFIKKWI